MKLIDDFIDGITMYRLTLYYLIFLLFVSFIASIFGLLSFSPIALIFSTIFIVIVGYITNKIFAYFFDANSNPESILISSLILSLIITPSLSIHAWPVFFWTAVWAAASKYIFAIGKKHIFNPAAIAVFIVSFFDIGSASWWIGTAVMLPFSLFGVLIVRKIRRFDLIFYFLVTAFTTSIIFGFFKNSDILLTFERMLLQSPIMFIAFVMLTEPLTTPPTKFLQGIYGAIIGFLFSPQIALINLITTPEIALIIGNLFSYITGSKKKLILFVNKIEQTSMNSLDYVFSKPPNFNYLPGQYMEFTLLHNKMDSRGARRYLSLASSPTEDNLRLGIEFYTNGSSFKKSIFNLGQKTPIVASDLRGDFVLPKNKSTKIVFLVGGIGITPIRSMIKFMLDTNDIRDFILLYSAKTEKQLVYINLLEEVVKKFGSRIYYTLTDIESISENWRNGRGRFTIEDIKRYVPDYSQRTFYISGPHKMVESYENNLKDLRISDKHIVTDYFSGYA